MARSTSFYYAFLALPAPRRRALIAVFDFCRAVDDAVDLETDPLRASAALAVWRGEVARIFSGLPAETEPGRALKPFAREFDLPRSEFDALIDGVAMDAVPRAFDTFADLEPYCHRVASSVGLICRPIFGSQEAAGVDYARDLGVALQLTNILRDVAVDFRRGRVYLPREDLARFGCGVDDIARAVERGGRQSPDAPLRAVLEHHASRARVFFARAVRALPPGEARVFLPAEIMRAIYFDLLRRIEASGCSVFGEVIRVPRPVQARLAVATWWRASRRA